MISTSIQRIYCHVANWSLLYRPNTQYWEKENK